MIITIIIKLVQRSNHRFPIVLQRRRSINNEQTGCKPTVTMTFDRHMSMGVWTLEQCCTVTACTSHTENWGANNSQVGGWSVVVVTSLVINKVKLRRAQLVLGLVTTSGRSTIPVFFGPLKPPQPGHPSVGRSNEYWQYFRPPLGKKGESCEVVCLATRHTGLSQLMVLAVDFSRPSCQHRLYAQLDLTLAGLKVIKGMSSLATDFTVYMESWSDSSG